MSATVQQQTTDTTPLVETDGLGGHSPRVRADLAEVGGSAIGADNPVPVRNSAADETLVRHVLEELRAVRTLLAILAGQPAIFPPLPEVRTS